MRRLRGGVEERTRPRSSLTRIDNSLISTIEGLNFVPWGPTREGEDDGSRSRWKKKGDKKEKRKKSWWKVEEETSKGF